MIFIKCIFIIFESLSIATAGFIPSKLVESNGLEVLRIDGLCRGHDVAMQSYHHGLKSSIRKTFVANHTNIVKQDFPDDLKINIIITRCFSRENLDSCEEFQNIRNINYCLAIDSDNILARQSPFAIKFTPKFKCPIKKGVYHAYNITVDISGFNFLSMESMYWKVKLEVVAVKERSKLIYCLHIEAHTLPRAKFQNH